MKIAQKAAASVKKNMKRNAFLTGAFILAAAGITCRALGVVLRIPLTNIVGNFGMGLYQMVFPLYALLLIISSAGFPTAISKMVAREKVDGNIAQCKKILLNALVLLGVIGFFVSILFVVFSSSIASLQGNKDVGIIYLAIAPSVFLVCAIAAFRGFFQGLQNMIPTAVSQIIEQLIKMAAGITLALVFIKTSVEMAVFGAILAVTISEVGALIFLIFTYIFTRKKAGAADDAEQPRKSVKLRLDRKLMSSIMRQSIPITLMASVFPMILVFDSLVIINLLKSAGQSHEAATQLFGIQSGAVHTLINLPAVLGVALGTAVVPTVTALIKQNKQEELRTKCTLALKMIFLIAIFFVGFYMTFSGQIIDLLYHSAFKDNEEHFKIARDLLRIESIMIVFMGLTSVFSSMLQAADRAKLPLIALGVGGALKIVFELVFITTPMGIYAVSISNVICFTAAAFINAFFALRVVKIQSNLKKAALRTVSLVGVFAMLLVALNFLLPPSRWWVIPAGALILAFFAALVLLLKIFDKAEKKVFTKLSVNNRE